MWFRVPEGVCALVEEDSANDVLDKRPLRKRSKVILTTSCALATAVSVLLLSPQVVGSGLTNDMLTADFDEPLGFVETVAEYGDCADYPYVQLHGVIKNNLGNHGPDSGDEGLVFNATGRHTGLGLNSTPLHIEIHNTSEYDVNYEKWNRKYWNGLHGHFGTIALDPGTNLSFEITARLPGSNDTLTMPKFAMSVFDLDIGSNNTVEFVELSSFDHYYITSNTTVTVDRGGKGLARFTATVYGNGTDNPEEPELLTVEQKHKSVTVEYSNVQKVPITIGAIGGSSGRVFTFSARPILLCAKTKTANGSIDPGEIETIENHTNGAGKNTGHSGTRDRCDAGFLGLMLSLSLLTTLASA